MPVIGKLYIVDLLLADVLKCGTISLQQCNQLSKYNEQPSTKMVTNYTYQCMQMCFYALYDNFHIKIFMTWINDYDNHNIIILYTFY